MSSVSFIIPVFNKSSFLKLVINSLKNQVGNFKREFIFIDDGSTDNSLNIIKNETKNLKNTFIIKQKNHGSAHATNRGIKLAKMKYIKFLDADDLIVNYATKKLMEILELNSHCILAYGSQIKVKDLDKANLNRSIDLNNIKVFKNPLKKAMRNSMFNPSQFLVRRKICQIVGGCDERVKFSQEYSLTLRLALKGSFAMINEPLAILPLDSPGQISEKKNNQIYRVSKALEFFIKDNPQIENKYKLYAQRRLTARAWRFARRHNNVGLLSIFFKLYLKGLLKLDINNINENCFQANKVYEKFLD